MKKMMVLAALIAMAMGAQADYVVSLSAGAAIYRGNATDTYTGMMYILTGTGYANVEKMAEWGGSQEGGLRSTFAAGGTIDIDAINAAGTYHIDSFQVTDGVFAPLTVKGTRSPSPVTDPSDTTSTFYTLFAVMNNIGGEEGSYILTFRPVSKESFGGADSKDPAKFTVGTGSVVPEPTSGLLLLLGMTGLAMRRKLNG